MSELDLSGGVTADRLRRGPDVSPEHSDPPSPTPAPGTGDETVMSVVDHLTELRRRAAISILAVVIASAAAFLLTPDIVRLLAEPIPDGELVFTTLGGAFFLRLRIAVLLGLALASPVVLYQLWAFVAPGLTPHERRLARPWLPLTMVFFLMGTAVAYAILPYTVVFLLGFQIDGTLEPLITAEAYFSFITTMFLAFGVVMQFPIVVVLLAKLRILSLERLQRSRRYVLLGIVIVAVVVTPGGDPISPVIMSAVMYLLYEVTILLMKRSARMGDGRAG
ncbi:twin-arginine translocase subunit TatC [soil metagenome]